jgi:hypothetical protein
LSAKAWCHGIEIETVRQAAGATSPPFQTAVREGFVRLLPDRKASAIYRIETPQNANRPPRRLWLPPFQSKDWHDLRNRGAPKCKPQSVKAGGSAIQNETLAQFAAGTSVGNLSFKLWNYFYSLDNYILHTIVMWKSPRTLFAPANIMNIGSDLKQNIPLTQRLLTGHDKTRGSLKVPASTVELLRASLKAARTQEKLFQASRSQRAKDLIPALRIGQADALDIIENAKSVLRFRESPRLNTVWIQAGFLTSTRTPTNWTERETLLDTLATFLKEHPKFEDASLNLTATIVLARATALSKALSEVDAHDAKHTSLNEARDAAKQDLGYRIRNFIKELKRDLTEDDSRWKTFGLESPATERALRPVRKERAESKSGAKAERRAQKAREKAAKARQRMEKVKLQVAKLQEAADQATRESRDTTSGITQIAA